MADRVLLIEQAGWTESGAKLHRAYFPPQHLVGPLSVCVSYPLVQSFFLVDIPSDVARCKRCFGDADG